MDISAVCCFTVPLQWCIIIIIISKTFLSQEASGTCDASRLPPDRLVSSIMGVVDKFRLLAIAGV